jgi:hypothetical protein
MNNWGPVRVLANQMAFAWCGHADFTFRTKEDRAAPIAVYRVYVREHGARRGKLIGHVVADWRLDR